MRTAALLLLLLSMLPLPALAQGSRIEQVTVYPGLAAVERSARVAAGARELVLNCLSPSFDMGSLRVEAAADAGIRIGPVSATTRPRVELPECSASPLDARIRALEERLAALQAESGGHELALAYLRGLGPGEGASAPRSTAPQPAALPAVLASIQRAGQQALNEQSRLAREKEAVERELLPLKSERDRLGRQQGDVRQLRIALAAAREGTLRLSYQVAGPTWAPAYRAALDFDARSVDIERLAQVQQASGEDWSGVALKLSTGSPRSATAGPQPRRWTVMPQPPAAPMPAPPQAAAAARSFSLAREAAAKAADDGDAPMAFAVQVNQGEFATEFEVPGTVDVASGAQRVSLALGSQRLPVEVKVQTTPAADASAWLVATLPVPAGVWPDGPLQLQRGTQAVGSSVWRVGQRERITLPFGRDEQVRVQVVPAQATTASTGFIGTRTERRIANSYVVENRRRSAIELEVLEASPVASDEQITVTRRFEPAVQPGFWQEQPGVVVWAQRLAPGQTARFSAEYAISHPKEMAVRDQR